MFGWCTHQHTASSSGSPFGVALLLLCECPLLVGARWECHHMAAAGALSTNLFKGLRMTTFTVQKRLIKTNHKVKMFRFLKQTSLKNVKEFDSWDSSREKTTETGKQSEHDIRDVSTSPRLSFLSPPHFPRLENNAWMAAQNTQHLALSLAVARDRHTKMAMASALRCAPHESCTPYNPS